jgi:hypothetical protein
MGEEERERRDKECPRRKRKDSDIKREEKRER